MSFSRSLRQALFATAPFRARVYAWQHDESKHGPPEESIPCQLQRLFARLQLSTRMAVDTTDLTRSFGWAAADACRQQDVQELLHVLFDALDRCVARKRLKPWPPTRSRVHAISHAAWRAL